MSEAVSRQRNRERRGKRGNKTVRNDAASDCHSSDAASGAGQPLQAQYRKGKQDDKLGRCNFGMSCIRQVTGKCQLYHTPEEVRYLCEFMEIPMHEDLVEMVGLLKSNKLNAYENVSIQNVEDLASFNRLGHGEIAIPGQPPRLCPLKSKLALIRDEENSEPIPFPQYTHVFEPLLRATQLARPAFKVFNNVDIISNASSLQNLFDLFTNAKQRTDRFDFEMVENVLSLKRWPGPFPSAPPYGYGHGFEKHVCSYAETDPEMLRESASHHRVVSYSFGGLRCVIQSEVDGYHCECGHGRNLAEPAREKTPDMQDSVPRHPRNPFPEFTPGSSCNFELLTLDDPGDSDGYLSVPAAEGPLAEIAYFSPTLVVYNSGEEIPSRCLVEVKTCNKQSQGRFRPEAQLFFSQRPQIYVAKHKSGSFLPSNASFQDVGAILKEWEGKNQLILGRVAAFLAELRDQAGRRPRQEALSVLCRADGDGVDGVVQAETYTRRSGYRHLPSM
ncbi:hypothetical protein GQ53DRAFT_836953 [Thozetella sp. PMI_491]|nr:hypothetical protein GQ53DRAFT_836953 [Thozetella sp. PMI_491]